MNPEKDKNLPAKTPEGNGESREHAARAFKVSARNADILAKKKSGWSQKRIGAWFGVGQSTVSEILSPADSTSPGKPGALRNAELDSRVKVDPRRKPEIAAAVGVDQANVARALQDLCDLETLPKRIKSAILHADFEPQIYSRTVIDARPRGRVKCDRTNFGRDRR